MIYYWYVAGSQILMLLIYAKSEQDDLTPQQLKVLRKIVEEEYPWKTNYSKNWLPA